MGGKWKCSHEQRRGGWGGGHFFITLSEADSRNQNQTGILLIHRARPYSSHALVVELRSNVGQFLSLGNCLPSSKQNVYGKELYILIELPYRNLMIQRKLYMAYLQIVTITCAVILWFAIFKKKIEYFLCGDNWSKLNHFQNRVVCKFWANLKFQIFPENLPQWGQEKQIDREALPFWKYDKFYCTGSILNGDIGLCASREAKSFPKCCDNPNWPKLNFKDLNASVAKMSDREEALK